MLRLWRQVIRDVMRDSEPMLSVIPCCGILQQVQSLRSSSQLIHKRLTCYGLVGGLVGLYLNSTAVLADVEEVSEGLGRSNSSISTPAGGLSIEPLMDNYDNISDKDVIKYNLDEDIIPEAVWSLHNNNPVHLDRIRDGVESQIYTGSDAHFESPILWTRTAIALWSGSNVYALAGLLLPPPPLFQVGSCGGSHAEHKDLDYCSIRGNDMLRREAEKENSSDVDGGDNTAKNDSNNVILSNDTTSSSDTDNQSTPTLSAATPTGNPLSDGDLIKLGQCDGAGVCAIVHIDLPTTPIDLPIVGFQAPSIDDPAPPIDLPLPVAPPPTQVTFLNNPEPGSDLPPVFTPSPLKPIPEASTWVMILIGFGAMAILYGKGDRRRISQVIVIAARKLVEKFIYRSAA